MGNPHKTNPRFINDQWIVSEPCIRVMARGQQPARPPIIGFISRARPRPTANESPRLARKAARADQRRDCPPLPVSERSPSPTAVLVPEKPTAGTQVLVGDGYDVGALAIRVTAASGF